MYFYKEKETNNIVYTFNDKEIMSSDFTQLRANTTDGAHEKHVPVYRIENNKIIVTVGEVLHPMTSEHYIMWIALVTENSVNFIKLEPNSKPMAEFDYISNSTIYAYCNLHGLWKVDVE